MTSPAPDLATFRVRVLGCKVNQYEAQQIAQAMEAHGLIEAAPGQPADVEVVHTCAVTDAAETKTRYLLRRAAAESSGGVLLATGCGAELAADDGILVVPAGPDWQHDLENALAALPLPRHPDGLWTEAGSLRSFRGHSRAFLKIQDGCDAGCTYCIVPSFRREPRDKPLDALVGEARALRAAGHREIVVTGVHVGAWNRGGGGLSAALDALAGIEGLERIRLSSLHPAELDDRLLAVWARHPAILPHIHLSLQSGSDRVLADMHRSYTRADFLDAVARARRALDRPSFSTDVIVGFPGEDEADFDRTMDICRQAAFSRIHIFPFSPRAGTPAAGMAGRPPMGVVRERVRRLKSLADDLAHAAATEWVGQTARVLCETRRPGAGVWEGYTERYLPVRIPGSDEWRGQIVDVRLRRAEKGVLWG